MNTILQKRIEEATTFLFKQRGLDKESCRQAMDYILANQWISVDEALPKESGDYLVIVKQSSDSEAYFHEISTYNATDNIWFYVGKLIVTHWAEIPSLEGGEK